MKYHLCCQQLVCNIWLLDSRCSYNLTNEVRGQSKKEKKNCTPNTSKSASLTNCGSLLHITSHRISCTSLTPWNSSNWSRIKLWKEWTCIYCILSPLSGTSLFGRKLFQHHYSIGLNLYCIRLILLPQKCFCDSVFSLFSTVWANPYCTLVWKICHFFTSKKRIHVELHNQKRKNHFQLIIHRWHRLWFLFHPPLVSMFEYSSFEHLTQRKLCWTLKWNL